MSRTGRKSKYDPLVTPHLAEEYAGEILTDAQIAMKLGISHETFYQWQKKYVDFSEAIKRGKAVSNVKLLQAMQKTAEGYEVEESETTVILDKNKTPTGYRKTTRKRYIPPSTTTQIFLAKNRMPDDFQDVNRQKVEISGSQKVNTLAELMMQEYSNAPESAENPEQSTGD